MALIIDGYNLLHATDLFGPGPGPDTLEKSRYALLNFLCDVLDPKELREATIVFDAAQAPPGLPQQIHHRGLNVRFAPKHEDADALIEELIEEYYAPRQLLIVSSDHRLHRAARRRGAKAIDSNLWYAEMVRQSQRRETSEAAAKPPAPASEVEVQAWLKLFEKPKP